MLQPLPTQLALQDATHCFDAVLHTLPPEHAVQTPPQPSESPQLLPVQLPVHAGFLQVHEAGSQVRPLAGQPVHLPPHPSEPPQVRSTHEGAQAAGPPSGAPVAATGRRLGCSRERRAGVAPFAAAIRKRHVVVSETSNRSRSARPPT